MGNGEALHNTGEDWTKQTCIYIFHPYVHKCIKNVYIFYVYIYINIWFTCII